VQQASIHVKYLAILKVLSFTKQLTVSHRAMPEFGKAPSLGGGVGLSQDLFLYESEHKDTDTVYAMSGIQTYNPSVRAAKTTRPMQSAQK
jgi:hypothetical protein